MGEGLTIKARFRTKALRIAEEFSNEYEVDDIDFDKLRGLIYKALCEGYNPVLVRLALPYLTALTLPALQVCIKIVISSNSMQYEDTARKRKMFVAKQVAPADNLPAAERLESIKLLKESLRRVV